MYKESQPSELSRFETIQLADFDAPFLMKQFSNIHWCQILGLPRACYIMISLFNRFAEEAFPVGFDRGQEPQKSRDVVKLGLFQVWIFHWVLVTQPQQEI